MLIQRLSMTILQNFVTAEFPSITYQKRPFFSLSTHEKLSTKPSFCKSLTMIKEIKVVNDYDN